MAFCAAYFGTIDTLRRLKASRPDLALQIGAVRKEATPGPKFKFILELRRNLSHGAVTVPGYSITSGFRSDSGTMIFDIHDLKAFGNWGAEVSTFFDNVADGRLPISMVTAECARGLALLRRQLQTLFQRNETLAEADFYRLQDTYHRTASRQFIKALIGSHTTKGTDPYPHLHFFFAPEEVRAILRDPMHSAEQVEFLIALRSPHTDCDDDLRAKLYKLFGVAPTEHLPATV